MLTVRYKPSFVREFKKLPVALQTEALERIALFADPTHHEQLRVHKLKGKLKGFYSFSISYSHRIVFAYVDRSTVVFLAVGDHDVYRQGH